MPAEARSAIAQPDFSQIFASAAALGELLTWPSEDYLRGWGYLQPQEAPPMEYFNAFYNGTDTKLLYLFTAANIRKSSTAYQVDDVITSPNLDSKFWLVCTQAGTSDANGRSPLGLRGLKYYCQRKAAATIESQSTRAAWI